MAAFYSLLCKAIKKSIHKPRSRPGGVAEKKLRTAAVRPMRTEVHSALSAAGSREILSGAKGTPFASKKRLKIS